jgi:molybdopterin converting factor small subunit
MTAVRIPPVLRPDVGGKREVDVDAVTVGEALRKLVAEYPALQGRILADGQVPSFLSLFVDGQDVRLLDGLETSLRPESALLLLPAVAGGGTAG